MCELNLAKESDNNSLLCPTQENINLFSSTELIGSIKVPSITFDSVIDEYMQLDQLKRLLVKLDIQGAEYDVLSSIDFRRIKDECWIYVELSSLDLYKSRRQSEESGGTLMDRVHKLLLAEGFSLIKSFNRKYTSSVCICTLTIFFIVLRVRLTEIT